MKKTIISIISIILAIFMLAGCSNTDNTGNDSGSTPTTTATDKLEATESTPDDGVTSTDKGMSTGAPIEGTQKPTNAEDSANLTGDLGTSGGEETPDPVFENKTVFKTEHFEIDSKMTKYIYAYLLNLYYQYYGQYATYYVTSEVVREQAESLLVYSEAAYAAGIELSTDQLLEIAESLEAHESVLKENGYESLAAFYGEGVDAEALINVTKLQYLANASSTQKESEIYDALVADKAGLEAYYDEHKELMFGTFVGAVIEDEAYYSRLAAATTKDELYAIAEEYCANNADVILDEIIWEQAAYYPELKEGETLTAFEEWFFTEGRAGGDIFTDAESKTVCIVILPAKKNTELLKSAGHILIIPTDNTEAHRDAAKKRAEALLAEYLAGEQTKEAFEAIAAENTEDGNVFYDDIYVGQMVESFNDWVYDEARKPGDTGIVETEYGFHVMYFVGDGELKNYEYFALSELYEAKLTEWEDEIYELYTISVDEDAFNELFAL